LIKTKHRTYLLYALDLINELKLREIYSLPKFIELSKGNDITTIVKLFMDKFDLNQWDIVKSLRINSYKGNVVSILHYGAFVEFNDYETEQKLFLHMGQITQQKISHPSEVLQVGQEIEFRIIGINEKNFRFNISCILDR
jgi:ribosomal protein S1